MLGQRASSQIVWSESPWMSFCTSKYDPSFDGARTFIHSGRRGRSATGRDVSIRVSVDASLRDSLMCITSRCLAPDVSWRSASSRAEPCIGARHRDGRLARMRPSGRGEPRVHRLRPESDALVGGQLLELEAEHL